MTYKSARNHLLVAGVSKRVRLVPAENVTSPHQIREEVQHTLLSEAATVCIPGRLDYRDVVEELVLSSRTDNTVGPAAISRAGWLSTSQVLLALCSCTDQVPVAPGTGCYVSLRGQETYQDPSVRLESVKIQELVEAGNLEVSSSGHVVTTPGRLLLTYRDGHIKPADRGDPLLMSGPRMGSLSVNGPGSVKAGWWQDAAKDGYLATGEQYSVRDTSASANQVCDVGRARDGMVCVAF